MRIYKYWVGRTKGQGDSIQKIKSDLLKINHICYLCNREFNSYSLQLEHKIPVMLGGLIFDTSNCELVCSKCHNNKTKIDKFIIKALKTMRLIYGSYEINSALSLEELEEFYLKYYETINKKIEQDSNWEHNHEYVCIDRNRGRKYDRN